MNRWTMNTSCQVRNRPAVAKILVIVPLPPDDARYQDALLRVLVPRYLETSLLQAVGNHFTHGFQLGLVFVKVAEAYPQLMVLDGVVNVLRMVVTIPYRVEARTFGLFAHLVGIVSAILSGSSRVMESQDAVFA